ncbi:MAG: site-2 protease family protein [Clostridiaceae bacterium]|nr:site-2 protease family protein [Clostridiaceae bacterium]
MSYLIGEFRNMLLSIPGIIFIFSFKGFFQSFIATKLGDPTPKNTGRLTMNPAAHIDLIGFIFIVLFGIGWSKPVQVRTRYFKKIKRDVAIFYLSGPVSCIISGFILFFIYSLISFFVPASMVINIVLQILFIGCFVALSLAMFYLLPLPGLDGYYFITNFVPYKYNNVLYNIEKYSMYIFIGFILLLRTTSLGYYLIQLPATLLLRFFAFILSPIL